MDDMNQHDDNSTAFLMRLQEAINNEAELWCLLETIIILLFSSRACQPYLFANLPDIDRKNS